MGRKSKALPARKAENKGEGVSKLKLIRTKTKETVKAVAKPLAKNAVRKATKAVKAVAQLVAVEKTTPPAVKAGAALKLKTPKVVPTAPAVASPQVQIAKAKAALKTAVKEEKATPKSRSKKVTVEASANESAASLAQKWATLNKKADQIESKPYNMKAVFEEKTAITHKVLGWGYILTNRNDRLEVLFKDGIKYLISNYKP